MTRFVYDITSRTNPLIKKTASLATSKGRRENGEFLFEGVKLFNEAVESKVRFSYIVITEAAKPVLQKQIDLPDTDIYVVPDTCFEKITTEKAPQGIVCVAKQPTVTDITETDMMRPALILSDIQDAGNLGTIIRTTKALADIDIVLFGNTADIFGPKCIRASMGSVFKQSIYSCSDFEKAVALYNKNGKTVYAAALKDNAEDIRKCDLHDSVVVLGNEGHGLSDKQISCCKPMIIPMLGMESLNVASAATVVIWEMVK